MREDITKKNTTFFFNLKGLSNKLNLFFTSLVGTLKNKNRSA